MRFRIIGADKETGEDIDLTIEAADLARAENYALRKQILISSVQPVSANLPPRSPPTIDNPPVQTSAQPRSREKVSSVQAVKLTCQMCGNVWYSKPGETNLSVRKQEALTGTACPKCNSRAISFQAASNEIVTPTKPGFFETFRAEFAKARTKRLEANRDFHHSNKWPPMKVAIGALVKAIILVAAVSIVLITIVGGFRHAVQPGPEGTNPVFTPSERSSTPMPTRAVEKDDATFMQNVISYAKYDELETGMAYSQVVEIIGHGGTETSSNKIEGVPGVMPSVTTKMYMWQNRDGTNANCIFQNDKLFQKSQFGLK